MKCVKQKYYFFKSRTFIVLNMFNVIVIYKKRTDLFSQITFFNAISRDYGFKQWIDFCRSHMFKKNGFPFLFYMSYLPFLFDLRFTLKYILGRHYYIHSMKKR